MSTSPHRAQHDPHYDREVEIPVGGELPQSGAGFDPTSWAEVRDVHGVATEGGRQILGWALSILALLWTGYTAWSAGRAALGVGLPLPPVASEVGGAPFALRPMRGMRSGEPCSSFSFFTSVGVAFVLHPQVPRPSGRRSTPHASSPRPVSVIPVTIL